MIKTKQLSHNNLISDLVLYAKLSKNRDIFNRNCNYACHSQKYPRISKNFMKKIYNKGCIIQGK